MLYPYCDMLNLKFNMGDNYLLGFQPNMGGNHTAATLQHQAKQNKFDVHDACAGLYEQTTLWAYPIVCGWGQGPAEVRHV